MGLPDAKEVSREQKKYIERLLRPAQKETTLAESLGRLQAALEKIQSDSPKNSDPATTKHGE